MDSKVNYQFFTSTGALGKRGKKAGEENTITKQRMRGCTVLFELISPTITNQEHCSGQLSWKTAHTCFILESFIKFWWHWKGCQSSLVGGGGGIPI